MLLVRLMVNASPGVMIFPVESTMGLFSTSVGPGNVYDAGGEPGPGPNIRSGKEVIWQSPPGV